MFLFCFDFNAIQDGNVHIHLYNKTIAKKGRKMGHVTIINDSLKSANDIADQLFKSLN